MSDKPLLFRERISTSPGKPVMAISTGTVISRSISSGLRPTAYGRDLHLYIGHIRKRVDSKILCSENTPPRTGRAQPLTTSKRCLSMARTIEASMA